jgi:hypothetical protein
MIDENWRLIRDFPDYSISDNGRVRRVVKAVSGPKPKSEFVKQHPTEKGYWQVVLYRDGKRFTCRVHRLVAVVFELPRGPEQDLVAHNDGNPQNNHVSNLRWATPKENSADKIVHGTHQIGERNGRSKRTGLTDAAVIEIRELVKAGLQYQDIAERFAISRFNVCLIATRRTWKHVA